MALQGLGERLEAGKQGFPTLETGSQMVHRTVPLRCIIIKRASKAFHREAEL
jgi:hypothetical protein